MKRAQKILASMLAVVMLAAVFVSPASACTGVIVGSDLTEDGTTIFARTEDLETNHNKVYKVNEAGKYKEGEEIVDKGWADDGYTYVLPHDSYEYTSVNDTTPEYGIFDEAGYNEKGVIADMTVTAYGNEKVLELDPYLREEGKAGISEGILTTVVLTSADTAREGIELVADIVAKEGSAEGNAFVIADADELWYMEIYSGHEFLAMRYPDDKFSVFPNSFWINEVSLKDGEVRDNFIVSEDEDYIYSKGIFTTAEKAGTLVGDEETGKIDLFKSYSAEPADSSKSRVTSGIKHLNPDSNVTLNQDVYEFLQDAEEGSISIKDVMNLDRNRLENLDMEADDFGGITYPIGNRNTMEAHIFQIPENADLSKDSVMWLTLGSPLVQPFVPYYPNQEKGIDQVENESNDPDPEGSAYWLAMDILHKVETNREDFMKVIEAKRDQLEDAFIEATKLKGTENPTAVNNKDAQESFDLLTEINAELDEKLDEIMEKEGYTNSYHARRSTRAFDGMTLTVPAGASDEYLNIFVLPGNEEEPIKFNLVDFYGNPIEEIEKEVSYKIPKENIEGKLVLAEGQGELSEDEDYYTITTDKTSISLTIEEEVVEENTIDRIAGENRYETAIELSKKNFDKADSVVLADGENYPDALAASVLVYNENAPLLLTSEDHVDEVKAEIERLGSKKVIIIGGENSVSEKQEAAYGEVVETERIAGANRYETALMIAEKIFDQAEEGQDLGLVVADGSNFADALAVGPYAAKQARPIILADGDKLPGAEELLENYKVQEVVIAGGENSVADLDEYFDPDTVTRIAGENRYETALEIAKAYFPEANRAYLANGGTFADALVLGAIAGEEEAPIFLSPNKDMPEEVLSYIKSSELEELTLIGGPNSLDDSLIEAIENE